VQAIIRPGPFRSSVPGRSIIPKLILVATLAALIFITVAEPAAVFTGP
jgi:hypothetical protein